MLTRNLKLIIITLAVVTVVGYLWFFNPPSSVADIKGPYKVIDVQNIRSAKNLEDILNTYSKDGYEYVGSISNGAILKKR